MIAYLGSVNLLEWLTELRKTIIYMYCLTIKDITKNASEQQMKQLLGKAFIECGARPPCLLSAHHYTGIQLSSSP